MTFLASASQRSLLIIQRNQYNYEKQLIMFRYNDLQNQINRKDNAYNTASANGYEVQDPSADPYYQWLEQQSNLLESEQESIDALVETINAQLEGLKTTVTNGIKTSCGLTYSGGGGS